MFRTKPRSRVAFSLFLGLAAASALSAGCSPAGGAPNEAAALAPSTADAATPAMPSGPASLAAAEELMKKRELDAALVMLKTLADAPGAEPKVFQRLAEVYGASREPAKAVQTLRRGLELHPTNGQLSYNLARYYQALNQYESACAELDKARANGWSERDVAMLYGTCLGQQNKLDQASAEFDKALAAGADEKTVRYNQALIAKTKKEFVKAQQMLQPLVDADPEFDDARRELAHAIVLGGGDAASANRGLGMLMDLKEKESAAKNFHLFEYMGDAWMLLSDYEAAVQCYTEALRLGQNPKVVEDKYRVAETKRREQKKAKADAEGPADDKTAAKKPDAGRTLPSSSPQH